MGLQELKKALNDSKKDTFAEGSVVRWTKMEKYSYAALKTSVGWYTTSAVGWVPKQVTFEELLEILTAADVSEVKVSTQWEDVLTGDREDSGDA